LKKVVPYHCLDYICTHWKKDDKGHVAPTIQATVTHFHKVTTCVITTCLGDQSMEAADRAKVVEHWIAVAWVCCKRGWGHPVLLSLISRTSTWMPGPQA
jgi:ral guanine nucleotide dissociation stimulator